MADDESAAQSSLKPISQIDWDVSDSERTGNGQLVLVGRQFRACLSFQMFAGLMKVSSAVSASLPVEPGIGRSRSSQLELSDFGREAQVATPQSLDIELLPPVVVVRRGTRERYQSSS